MDIVAVIGRYLPLEAVRHGWRACCPFHAEQTPSFVVVPTVERFHCFGCGAAGDGLDFIARYERCSREEAQRRLATWTEAGV